MQVRLTAYNEHWANMYEEETQVWSGIFGILIVRFEHFGSTSVPGMVAKPVIDIMCIVSDMEQIDSFNTQMISLGYDAARDWGITGRRLFRKGGEQRTHHIHVYPVDHSQIERHLILRDYLRCHPEEVTRYSRFKEDLAARYERTSDYSPAKKQFVSEMEQLAFSWRNSL